MIKQAQTTDLEAVCLLGKEFFEECKLPGVFNPDVFIPAYSVLMVEGLAEVWLLETETKIVGAIGGMFSPDPFTGDLVASESFWYVSPFYRKLGGFKLFQKFLDRAQERGCARVSMAAVAGSPTFENVKNFYESMDMIHLETYYVKRL